MKSDKMNRRPAQPAQKPEFVHSSRLTSKDSRLRQLYGGTADNIAGILDGKRAERRASGEQRELVIPVRDTG